MKKTRQLESEAATLLGYIAQMEHRIGERSKQEYSRRIAELSRRTDHPAEAMTPRRLVDQLEQMVRQGSMAGSSFRNYRAAIKYWLGQQAQALIATGGDHTAYASEYERLGALRYTESATRSHLTSARKLKLFPAECANALTRYAEARHQRASSAVRAAAFVRANLLVGLRPSEWFHTAVATYLEVDESGQYREDLRGRLVGVPMLVVENAKHSHGRANGPHRELLLHKVAPEEMKALVHFWQIACEYRDLQPPHTPLKSITEKFYSPLNSFIRRALKTSGYAGHAIPTAYSTRHQVVADFKASGVEAREIAAFFGHASKRTAREHYGLKRHGSREVTFRASPESVAKVARQAGLERTPRHLSSQDAANVEHWLNDLNARKASPQ